MTTTQTELIVPLRRPHTIQKAFIDSPAKRKVVRGGRRGGKTTGLSILAVEGFLAGRRILYATPTLDQVSRFWHEVKLALTEPIEAGIFYKNETQHIIERPGTEQRIRAKTAWNADTLRGDFADDLLLDEWQLMSEDAWDKVGAPMLLDNDGDAVFIYTPRSFHSRSVSKATDPMHAAKLFKKAKADKTGRWEAFHFTSHDNPHISEDALAEITSDMSAIAYRMEILAEDIEDVPGALWTHGRLDKTRVTEHPDLYRIVVGVDPQASTGQTGIVVVGAGYPNGKDEAHGYTLDDMTTEQGASTYTWGAAVVEAYHKWGADIIVGEVNNGGDMVEHVIRSVPGGEGVNYQTVRATRGKYTRAEPIAALFETDERRNKVARGHHVGFFPHLEDELCTWVPGDSSPNRLDAVVWAYTELDPIGSGQPAGEIVGDIDMGTYKSKRKKSIWT